MKRRRYEWCVSSHTKDNSTCMTTNTPHISLLENGKHLVHRCHHRTQYLHHVVIRRLHQLCITHHHHHHQRWEGLLTQRGRHVTQEVNLRHERKVVAVGCSSSTSFPLTVREGGYHLRLRLLLRRLRLVECQRGQQCCEGSIAFIAFLHFLHDSTHHLHLLFLLVECIQQVHIVQIIRGNANYVVKFCQILL